MVIIVRGELSENKIIGEHVNGGDSGARVAAHREDFLYGIGALQFPTMAVILPCPLHFLPLLALSSSPPHSNSFNVSN